VFSHRLAVMFAVAALQSQAEVGRPFDVKPTETVIVDRLRVTFDGVTADSRCPTGADCMWAGDAAAAIAVERPPAAPQRATLHTSGRFVRQIQYEGMTIRLQDVKPYPQEGASIPPDEYRATIVVTRSTEREALAERHARRREPG